MYMYMLRCKYGSFESTWAHSGVSGSLLGVCGALLGLYRALLGVYTALLNVYRVLIGTYVYVYVTSLPARTRKERATHCPTQHSNGV